jgi:hypothetical protein
MEFICDLVLGFWCFSAYRLTVSVFYLGFSLKGEKAEAAPCIPFCPIPPGVSGEPPSVAGSKNPRIWGLSSGRSFQ